MASYPQKHLAVGHTSPTSGLVSFETPTEAPNADEALIRVQWVVVSAFDRWQDDFSLAIFQYPVVFGISVVGEVVEAGNETDFKSGDKVLSTSFTPSPKGKAFQEYATISRWSLSKLPTNVAPEEAVTVPDNLVTAYFALFGEQNLGLPVPSNLPPPSSPAGANIPILVWGAGGSVGQYALQVLKLAGYTNVIAVASSRHHDYLRSLGATSTIDYRAPDVAEKITKEAGGKVKYIFDTISDEKGSLEHIAKVVGEGSKVAFLPPVRVAGEKGVQSLKETPSTSFPEHVEVISVRTFFYQANENLKKTLQPVIVPKLLGSGLIKPNRIRKVDGANLLERIKTALDIIRRDEVSGERLVVHVQE